MTPEGDDNQTTIIKNIVLINETNNIKFQIPNISVSL